MRGKWNKAILAIMILILVVLIAQGKDRKFIINNVKEETLLTAKENGENTKNVESEVETEDVEEVKEKKIKIVATGDILIHQEILDTQYDENTGEYDFNNNFQYVKDILSDADLAIGNLETTLSGYEMFVYSGYPSFNSPDSLADAMKNAGFDIIANMNNHCLDRDVSGYHRTRQTLVDKGFDVIGTRASEDDKRYVIKDIDGIKVGVISYGYLMTTLDYTMGVNGITVDDSLLPLMTYFYQGTIDENLNNMKEQIELMREDGAEVIVFYMHWGDEYELEPNYLQLQIAQFLADQKVDVVFGTHPHSLQPIDMIQSTDGTSQTVVVYSMGNFLSSQRTERIGNPYTEDGVIVSVEIIKDMDTNEVKVEVPTYIPTWVNWDYKDGKLFYEVVPATIDDAEYLTEEGKVRVKESFNRTQSILEQYDDAIEVGNFN